MTLLVFAALIVAAGVVLLFPYLELRRFTEPPSHDPDLTARLLSIIDANDEFAAGEFINDVSIDVCTWASEQKFRSLVEQPGWQLTAHGAGEFWFKKTSFWPWDRDGIQIGLSSDEGCYAYVRRSDAI